MSKTYARNDILANTRRSSPSSAQAVEEVEVVLVLALLLQQPALCQVQGILT